MPFDKLPSKKKSQHVIEQILNSIRSGRYGPGDRLPAEHEIADMTGVSRPAVREALGALRLLGILDSRPGSGTFVQSVVDRVDIASLIESGGHPFEALEVRIHLEPVVASLAMEGLHEREGRLAAVGEEVRKMHEAHRQGDDEAIGRCDRDFHRALADACGNSLLRDFMHSVLADCLDSELGTKFRRAFLVEPHYKAAMLRIHTEIYRAMVEGNAVGMQRAFAEHFRRMEDQLLGSRSDGVDRPAIGGGSGETVHQRDWPREDPKGGSRTGAWEENGP